MFERPYIQHLTERIKEPRAFIQVLIGPRQVGKSTLTGQLLDKLSIPNLFVSADAMANSGETWLEQQWEAARIQLKSTEASEFILAIDEIQKITNWSEVVKKLSRLLFLIADHIHSAPQLHIFSINDKRIHKSVFLFNNNEYQDIN